MQTETKPDIFEILTSTPEEVHKMLIEELKKDEPDLELIDDILTYTLVDVNAQDERGWTALMRSARREDEKCLKLLLNHPGIDVNLQSEDGWTALIHAVMYERENCIKLLLNQPMIDVNVRSVGGWTAWGLTTYSIRQRFPKLFSNS
jgi:hypothetical protein